MKNIHIMPTDKPSKLFKNNGILYIQTSHGYPTGYNIYITSDEEIKEGDWYLDISMKTCHYGVHKCNSQRLESITKRFKDVAKKIIITTDQDLIKDGIQSIDDEFLEWYVKNPSCESVEVVDNLKYFNVDELRERHLKGLPHLYSEKIGYKIVIPKEELKMIECYFTPRKDTSSATICSNCGQEKFLHTIGERIKVSTYIVNAKEEPKQDLEKEMFELEEQLDIPSHLRWHNSKPKQETLEEVRVVKRTELYNSILSIVKQIPRKEVESDAMDAPSCAYELEQLFLKWQQERMYADMEEYAEFCIRCDRANLKPIIAKDWFEQFKKDK